MKIARFLSFLIVVIFAVTALIPTSVYAQPPMPDDAVVSLSFANQKTATLIVTNESGGTLRVSLSGPKSYNFSSSKAGKVQFTGIEPGKYTIRLSATTCADVVSVTKNLSDKVNLKETVCAKKADKNKDKSKEKAGSLTVDNKTGGTLYVSLTGPKAYYFNTSKQGKTTFDGIDAGKYTITVRSSACGGSLTYTKNINGKTSLKPFICRH